MSNGKPYSRDEEKQILDYIVQQQAYDLLKGNKFWKDLEEEEIVKRSAQSMKEHFRKILLFKLHYPYYELTMEERERITQGYKTGQITRKPKPKNDD